MFFFMQMDSDQIGMMDEEIKKIEYLLENSSSESIYEKIPADELFSNLKPRLESIQERYLGLFENALYQEPQGYKKKHNDKINERKSMEIGFRIQNCFNKLNDLLIETQINEAIEVIENKISGLNKTNEEVTEQLKKLSSEANETKKTFDVLEPIAVNFEKKSAEIDKIMSNIYGFFGLVVGLLAFIFVNYQFISSAKDLGIGKMVMFIGIANVGLILGIIIILGFLAHILDKENQIKKMTNALKSGSFIVAIILILVGGYAIYQREDKPKEQAEKIKMENISDKFVGLEQKINNLLDENTSKTEEIKELQKEIEVLKNKK